jgi:hypothetical protein
MARFVKQISRAKSFPMLESLVKLRCVVRVIIPKNLIQEHLSRVHTECCVFALHCLLCSVVDIDFSACCIFLCPDDFRYFFMII